MYKCLNVNWAIGLFSELAIKSFLPFPYWEPSNHTYIVKSCQNSYSWTFFGGGGVVVSAADSVLLIVRLVV